jgi:hypothetical protein
MGNVGHRAFRWIVLSVLAANVAWFEPTHVYFPHSVLLITTDARGTITEIRPVGGEG